MEDYFLEAGGTDRSDNGGMGISAVWVNGGDEGNRTPDLSIANAALSQLSYIPTIRPPCIADRNRAVNGKKSLFPL